MESNVYVLSLGKEVIGVFSSLPKILKQRAEEASKRKKANSDFRIAKYIVDTPGEELMIPLA